jgi:hypothetical protein
MLVQKSARKIATSSQPLKRTPLATLAMSTMPAMSAMSASITELCTSHNRAVTPRILSK